MSEHICTPETCPVGNYFVTAIDAGRVYRMAGPYGTHKESLENVDKALKIANKHDGRAWFMSWGTARFENVTTPGSITKAGLI